MRLLPFSRFIVHDKSMEPSYNTGDHVMTFNWIVPRVGDVVVFQKQGTFFLKRVVENKSGSLFVSGDNRNISSKTGPIKSSQIVGKVILKY